MPPDARTSGSPESRQSPDRQDMAGHRPLCGNHLSLAVFPALSDTPPTKRQPGSLGLVSACVEPPRTAKAFRSGPSGRVPLACAILPLSPPARRRLSGPPLFALQRHEGGHRLRADFLCPKRPADTHILIRNHPLDNGLIDYAGFIASFAVACGISDRVHFIEGGKAHQMMDKSLGVVVLNSTIGISALRQGKPVYCVGTSIYAMPAWRRTARKCRWMPSGINLVTRKMSHWRTLSGSQGSCPGQREFLYPRGHQHGH